MSQPITEVAFVPMVPDADLTDPDNFAYKIVDDCCKITMRQPGYERGVWGVIHGKTQIWVTLTDWDDLTSHENYTKTAEHDQELEWIGKMCNEPIEVFHVPMEYDVGTTADNKIRAPVIDVVTGYFPVTKARSLILNRSVSTNGHAQTNGESKSSPVPMTYASGWSVEEDGPIFSPDGKQGARPGKEVEKPWCGVFGWAQPKDWQMEYVMKQTAWIEKMGGERVVAGRIQYNDY